jgi:hypothetical protein
MNWHRRRRRKTDTKQLAMALVPPGMRTFGYWLEIGAADKLRRRVIVRCRQSRDRVAGGIGVRIVNLMRMRAADGRARTKIARCAGSAAATART